jgi:predicted acylesterase/phospholipase RssA
MRPDFTPEQEVRFAVVMYGGVSLAIYINGVAQELFRLVRATAPEVPYTDRGSAQKAYFPTDAEELGREPLDAVERVYRTLGQILHLSGRPDEPGKDDDPIRTRFVVDIVSGTSAGGINGVFLGRAIARQEDFGVSSRLWRETADIGVLLNDETSYEGLPKSAPRTAQSLLNGLRLYWKAREALSKMAETAQDPESPILPSYAEQLDLAVTSTDLAGLPLPIRLSDTHTVMERTHRAVFRFSYGTEDATGEEHSDFENTDLMLGFSARATSSFPFAFEPVRLADVRDVGYDPAGDAAERPADFMPQHARARLDVDRIVFGDGGYLDNKPFSYATETLRSRRADVPVDRRLVYIEPHPTDEKPAAVMEPRPDVISSVELSFGLPRQETIRADIAAVSERNHTVERLRDLGMSAERALEAAPAIDAQSAPYRAYQVLRVRTVLDALAELGALLRGEDEDGDLARRTRDRLRAWVDDRSREEQAAFLEATDAAFRQRLLSFLHDRINDLLRGDERAAQMAELARRLGLDDVPPAPPPPLDADQARALRDLKQDLNGTVDALRRARRAPLSRDPAKVFKDPQLRRFLDVKAAADKLPDEAEAFLGVVQAFLATPLQEADANLKSKLEDPPDKVPPWIAALLQRYRDRFEEFDMIVLPLAYPDLGETNSVAIMRISPLDATGIKPESVKDDPTHKLAGIRVKHFGGFLDADWRNNDMMWGRLDAAEAIIGALVGDTTEGLGRTLRERAQAAILRQELGNPDFKVLAALGKEIAESLGSSLADAPDGALVQRFRERYKELPELDAKDERDIVARGIHIGSRVMDQAAADRHWPRPPFKALGGVGPPLAKAAMWLKDRRSGD